MFSSIDNNDEDNDEGDEADETESKVSGFFFRIVILISLP